MVVISTCDEVKNSLHIGIYIRNGLTVDQHTHGILLHLKYAEQTTQIEVIDKGGIDTMATGTDR